MRVLILSASYGSGHNEAARTLARAFQQERVDVTLADHFRDFVHPLFERGTRALYYTILRRAPALWAAAYQLADRMASDSALTFGVTRVGTERLARFLEELAPDAVVTCHATPSVAMSALAATGRRLPPHVAVVTDFVAHSQWMAEHVDHYCVAAEEVRNEFVARGVAPARVLVTGFPVRPEFEEPLDPTTVRRDLGLSSDAPVVLAMAGSHGALGRLADVTEAMLRSRRPMQGLVVTGHDEALEAALRRRTLGTGIRVFGYVRDIRRLVAAADLLITKAGGMTLAEALAAEIPLLTYGSLPGQERRNEVFASRAGIALVARSRRQLDSALERALGEPELLDFLRKQTRLVRQPNAARRIVASVLGLLA